MVTFDADVLIGHYPFRKFACDSQDPMQIKDLLLRKGVQRACVASIHAAFYPDPDQGNREVLPHLVQDDFFLPVGTVNPALHNWVETLNRCVDDYGCRMVRLLPNYHMYSLSDGFVDDFLAEAQRQEVVVSIAKRLEDERMHHLLMKVPAVSNEEIAALVQRFPHPTVVLSAYLGEIKELTAAGELVYFDIAFAETLNTMKRLTEAVSPERLLFSTHTPFFYPEAAVGKVEQWETSNESAGQVRCRNLIRLLRLG